MQIQRFYSFTILLLFLMVSCGETPKKKQNTAEETTAQKDSVQQDSAEKKKKEKEKFVLTEENAIDFFFDYQKGLTENKVKITTSYGSFTVELYDNVPYHKANFIYLTKKGYFNGTQFHRVVKNFIIQGGSSDDKETARKRREIGRYLLPPDTRKGYRHHRGTISMPSSEIDNPHMLASPYEFFIVVTDPGSYHLDGDFTPFGRVISGMDVVDEINHVEVGDGDWPHQNVYIEKAEIVN
ncbi:peptidylprolyl isomerase [Euzebyella saccharophila]|uniref:Peptidyl-prolyl cis-trans isomerase n=1 Tax=Euzebyella saccharophila TaxID=679664 RepID=A0ABV8JQ65_9FLAO|nr:peptidylprolyl isomerase [Euzebyella saccharophila]